MRPRTTTYTLDLTEGADKVYVPVEEFVRASVRVVQEQYSSTTGVIEVKRAWTEYDDGVSFSPAVTLSTDGSSPSLNIDTTLAPYIVLDVTTFDSGKEARVVVHQTTEPDPFPEPRLFALDVSRGLIAGVTGDRKFGANSSVGSSWESVTNLGSALAWPTAAETLDIVSSSGNDTSAGSGARTFTVVGLDANWETQTETVALNGTSAVTTSGSFVRVLRGFVATAGTYGGSNAGAISVDQTTSGDSLLLVSAGAGQSSKLAYTVPAGHTAYIDRTAYFVDASKSVDIRARIRLNADDSSAPVSPWRVVQDIRGISAPVEVQTKFSMAAFPAKTDIVIEAQSTGGGGSVDVSGAVDILLVQN